LIIKLLGGSDKINGTEVDAAIYEGEVRIRERIDDYVGGQYVIHKYTVRNGKAYWVSTDFLGRRKRIEVIGTKIPSILMYERLSDAPTRLMVKQLEIELARNKPVLPEKLNAT
jgi:hypothetical protein